MTNQRRGGPLSPGLLAAAVVALLASCGGPAPAVTPPSAGATVSDSGTAAAGPSTGVLSQTPTATPAEHTSSSGPTSTSTPTTRTLTGCAAVVSRMTLRERVGQLLMVGINSSGPTAANAAVFSGTRAGSVLLLGNSTAGMAAIQRVTGRVRLDARRPQGVGTLIAADQEGGLVQRLKGSGFSTIPSAVSQGKLSDATLTADAKTWGRQLKQAGVNVDLAPVADVVPPSMITVNQPIGVLRRYYSTNPSVVATKVRAFVTGMSSAGIVTSAKHFPGLGRVRGNTDFQADVVDSTTVRHDAALGGFSAGARAGVDMVMVSSATYAKIDSKRRAAFSPVVIGTMIRGDLGFRGVVISDDLAAKAMQDLSPGTRVIDFVRASGDLAIIGDPTIAQGAANSVVAEAERSASFSALVTASATRVVELKHRRGLASC